MSARLNVHRHNPDNPKCPTCYGISKKTGKVVRKKGKFQRYLCLECGRTFQEPLEE